jgi:hypothetical protein
MSETIQRRWVGPAAIAAATLAAALICALSYFADLSYTESLASIGQIDLLKGDLADHWTADRELSGTKVHFKQNDDGVVEIDVLTNTPWRLHMNTGIRYVLGFLSPGWYEFAGEFQADTDDTKGIGAELEVKSGRWRFATKSDSLPVERRKKFDVYFRPSDAVPDAQITCRFFGPGSNRSARAFLRDVRFVKIVGEPPPTASKFDLQAMEVARLGVPPNTRHPSFRGLGVVVFILIAIIGVCWRLLEQGLSTE